MRTVLSSAASSSSSLQFQKMNFNLRILVYVVMYDSRKVSLEHFLLSRYPSQRGLESVEPNKPKYFMLFKAWFILQDRIARPQHVKNDRFH